MPGAARLGAWSLCALTLGAVAAQAGFLVAAGVPLLSPAGLEHTFPFVPLALVIGAVVGALIVGRHPRHRVGWLLCVGQAGAAVGLAAQSLASAADAGLAVPAETAHVAAWMGHLLGATYALAMLGLLFLLVPDGHLPSRRWAPVGVLLAGGFVTSGIGLLLAPLSAFDPDAGASEAGLAVVLVIGGQLAVAVGLAGGATAFVVRLRRSRGEERQQLRWVGAAAAVLALAVTAVAFDGLTRGSGQPHLLVQASLYVAYLGVLIATGFAVLRHRLYDVDVIIGRAVRLAVLAVFVTVGYVAGVVTLATLLGGSSRVWPSLVAYTVVALAFQPLRRRVDRFADRIVYGERSGPYDRLAELSRQLSAVGRSEDEVLRMVARSSALAVGARAARARVALPGAGDRHEDWPDSDKPAAWDVTVPVTHHGEVLGSIELALWPGDRLAPAHRRPMAQLAAQAALVLRNLRLTAALRARADDLGRQRAELAASRRRLLRAGDVESERVAAAIRTEVAVHLKPLPATLAELRSSVIQDPGDAASRLADLQRNVTLAIEDLRRITAGVLPPLLARRGLVPAVEAYARQSPGRCLVTAGPGVTERRLPPSVEAAAYLWCIRSIEALAPGARATMALTSDRLVLAVRGPGGGDMAGREQVLDRLDAVGGQVDEPASPDGETEWRAALPLDPSAQADASRSGPKADLLM